MSVTLTYNSTIQVAEVLSAALNPAAAAPTITHSAFNTTKSLNAGSSPAVSLVAAFNKALSGGAATIDLTALAGTNGAAVDGTGKKVISAKFINPATNANQIQVKAGAANAYLLGGTSWSYILQPGDEILIGSVGGAAATTPTIDSTHKNIDLVGTAAQALECILVLG